MGQADPPGAASRRHAHELRNLALALRLAADLLPPEDAAVRRIQAAVDGLFRLADEIEADSAPS